MNARNRAKRLQRGPPRTGGRAGGTQAFRTPRSGTHLPQTLLRPRPQDSSLHGSRAAGRRSNGTGTGIRAHPCIRVHQCAVQINDSVTLGQVASISTLRLPADPSTTKITCTGLPPITLARGSEPGWTGLSGGDRRPRLRPEPAPRPPRTRRRRGPRATDRCGVRALPRTRAAWVSKRARRARGGLRSPVLCHRPAGDLGSRGEAELGQDVAYMTLHRALGDEQPGADLLVAQAFGHEPRDIGFALAEDA
jgi:hypothetical protein